MSTPLKIQTDDHEAIAAALDELWDQYSVLSGCVSCGYLHEQRTIYIGDEGTFTQNGPGEFGDQETTYEVEMPFGRFFEKSPDKSTLTLEGVRMLAEKLEAIGQ